MAKKKQETQIAYKVVEKQTRHCSNWAMFIVKVRARIKGGWSRDSFPCIALAVKFGKEHIEYFPRYLKGTTVKAAKGSVGILTFGMKREAKNFLSLANKEIDWLIIEVEGFGPRPVKYLNGLCGAEPSNIIKDNNDHIYPPRGTIGFDKVKVLE